MFVQQFSAKNYLNVIFMTRKCKHNRKLGCCEKWRNENKKTNNKWWYTSSNTFYFIINWCVSMLANRKCNVALLANRKCNVNDKCYLNFFFFSLLMQYQRINVTVSVRAFLLHIDVNTEVKNKIQFCLTFWSPVTYSLISN